MTRDARPAPATGSAYYYLLRGQNVCGSGSYGAASGGAAAHAVGERLARLAEDRQVLVVTHSPQVAARAAHHWRVSKQQKGGTTNSRVRRLDSAERQEEIARMLSGAEVTDEARAAAGRLIGAA